MKAVTTIDTEYAGIPQLAAAYLLRDGDTAAFVETNTTHAVPRLLDALSEAGMSPDQVQYVIVTHIHLDHAGGAGALMRACPQATLVAHPRAAPHAIDPTKLEASARKVYGSEFDALYGEIVPVPEARVRTCDDGEMIPFGARTLTFLHTRGHANHHFCVRDSAGGIFTGDSFGIVYPLLQRHGPFAFPSTTPTDFDPEAAHASVDRIATNGADVAYLTHFGGQTDFDEIASQLHRQLDHYASWVDEGDRSGREGPELDAWCRERVAALFSQELERIGLAGDSRATAQLEMDIDLNAQGVSFAIQKRRFKRSRA